MKTIKIVTPNQCHLWKANITPEELDDQFEPKKAYIQSSHLDRALMACKACGQLYFYEWLEEIDWENGNDPQYSTWIPVKNAEDSDQLNNLSSFELLQYSPRLQKDFPVEANQPEARWVGFSND